MDLVTFLRARYDDDERAARASEKAETTRMAAYAADRRVTVTEAHLTNHWDVGEEDDQCPGWRITAGTFTEVRDGRTQVEPWEVVGPGYTGGGAGLRETAEHIARHDPARVLADVAAGRRTIERYEEQAGIINASLPEWMQDQWSNHPDQWRVGIAEGLEIALKVRAQVYDWHPDYRSEWKP